jgi:hypothetical protein
MSTNESVSVATEEQCYMRCAKAAVWFLRLVYARHKRPVLFSVKGMPLKVFLLLRVGGGGVFGWIDLREVKSERCLGSDLCCGRATLSYERRA